MNMFVFGMVVAAIGAGALGASVVLELMTRAPIYMILAKISAGVFGVGGIILAVAALR